MDDARDIDSESDIEADPGPSTSHHHLSSSSRQMRNEAEKKRRDTLNGYITELGRLVPTVDSTPRRIDKISILRLAATYLMQNQILHSGRVSQRTFLPISLESYNLSLSMVEDMDAFMLVVTSAGKIVFVSHTVEKLLGHAQIDMFGQSLYNFTLKEDHSVLAYNLQPDGGVEPNLEGGPDVGSGDETSCSSEASLSPPPAPAPITVQQETQRRSFFLQLSQKCVSRSEQPEYKRVHVFGNLRVPQNVPPRRRTRRNTGDWSGGEGGSEVVLVAMVKLEGRIKELSLMEASKDEYVTRHLIDGRIIYSDHRISLVAGYLTEEVSGMSAFKFMHHEDVMFTIVALRQMYDRGEGFGCSCYRLQSKTGQFIYLRTHGYLEKNEETNEVESFICVNTLVREEDGKRLIQEMKTRYSANIEATQRKAITESEVKLEEAISQLIPSTVDPPSISSPFPDTQYMKAALTGKSLPPASVHASQAGLGSPKPSTQVARPSLGSPGPSAHASRPSQGSPGPSTHATTPAPGSPVGSSRHMARPGLRSPGASGHPDRPSVITLRRRRHDSDTAPITKRRRSPQHEELVIEVPPQMSPEELTHAILTRGQSVPDQSYPLTGSPDKQTLYSPPTKTRRFTHSSDLSLSTPLPLDILSCDSGEETLSTYHSTRPHIYPQDIKDAHPNKRSLLSPSQDSYGNRDSLLSPSHTPYTNRVSLLSPNQASYTSRDDLQSPSQVTYTNRDDLLSPSQKPYTSRDNFSTSSQAPCTNRVGLLSPSQPSYTNRTDLLSLKKAPSPNKDEVLSPNQALYPYQDEQFPMSIHYPGKVVSNSNQSCYRRQVLMSSDTADDESMYSLDVSSSEHSQYLIESMLNQPDLPVILSEMDQVAAPSSSDNCDTETPLYLIVEQSHSQLESNLQLQQMQITSIKQDIKQVPKPHSDQVFKNFTELEDEHKQNQHMLHILKQDITRTCT